jgi:hypothetical protein
LLLLSFFSIGFSKPGFRQQIWWAWQPA